MYLLLILVFVALLGCAVYALFLPRSQGTFTPKEFEAFEHVERVKNELAKVQGMVGPPKAPFTLSLGGSYLPAPAKKPEGENKPGGDTPAK